MAPASWFSSLHCLFHLETDDCDILEHFDLYIHFKLHFADPNLLNYPVSFFIRDSPGSDLIMKSRGHDRHGKLEGHHRRGQTQHIGTGLFPALTLAHQMTAND